MWILLTYSFKNWHELQYIYYILKANQFLLLIFTSSSLSEMSCSIGYASWRYIIMHVCTSPSSCIARRTHARAVMAMTCMCLRCKIARKAIITWMCIVSRRVSYTHFFASARSLPGNTRNDVSDNWSKYKTCRLTGLSRLRPEKIVSVNGRLYVRLRRLLPYPVESFLTHWKMGAIRWAAKTEHPTDMRSVT